MERKHHQAKRRWWTETGENTSVDIMSEYNQNEKH